jgi:hypothetical protein
MDVLWGFSKFCNNGAKMSSVLISYSYFGSDEMFLPMKQINHSSFILWENKSLRVCSNYQLGTHYGPKEGEERYTEHYAAHP